MTDEQKARLADNLQKARDARAAKKVAEVPAPAGRSETQCAYCGVRFDDDIIERHMVLAHGQEAGEAPAGPADAAPGTIVRPTKGLPYKVRWTREHLEALCDKGEGGFSWQTIVPMRTTTVSWNGIAYPLNSGEDNRVPSPIAAIYFDSERETARAVRAAGVGDTVQPRSVYRQTV